jgi:crotonobetainyl-CoA:carnitine CoA-transferase CaiB-like acyl-CoA transferase
MLRPFAGLRVLEIGESVAAAYGARILADLGAEVIKLEPPGARDANRRRDPFGQAVPPLDSALFGYLNHGKRSVALDLASRLGARLARDLAERCALLVYEPQALAGDDAFDPAARDWPARPTTVAASLYGLAGVRSAVPASPFVVQHASGFAFHQASPVHDPAATPPVAGADWEVSLAAGIVVALAAMWGLRSAQGTRPGPLIDLSTQDVLTYLLVEPFADWLDGAEVGRRQAAAGETTTIAGGLVWLLPCADGAVLVSPREDHQWHRWVAVMERPDWARDERLCGDREVRKANALALQRRMAHWSAQRSCREIFARAQEHRVACFPISTARDLLANEQLIDRRFFSRLALGGGHAIPVPGLPFLMMASDGQTLERGAEVQVPALGEATQALLSALLRLGPGEIEHLRRAGIL